MRRPRQTALISAALIAVQSAWLSESHSQDANGASLAEQASKQAGIYASRGVGVSRGYVIDRSLLSYTFILPHAFKATLARLGSNDRWLDIGAGEGRAIVDYRTAKYDVLFRDLDRSGEKAKAVAISIEDRRTSRWYATAETLERNEIDYRPGKRLREYSTAELGRFQLITDVMGGFSYTRDLTLFMQKALGFLATNGAFYTVLQDVRQENGSNQPFYPDASFLTRITGSHGSDANVCSWLKEITCVAVTCEARPEMSPPAEVYAIHKTCDEVSVPALRLIYFEAGTPPERHFESTTRTAR
jgi:hypothetical protein